MPTSLTNVGDVLALKASGQELAGFAAADDEVLIRFRYHRALPDP
jgi:hypothetical protein